MNKLDLAKVALNPTGFLIEKILTENVEAFDASSKNSTVMELKEDALREDIKAMVLQNKAKVEQELAIARRIDSAEEVEIEEFYDLSGNGGLGIKMDEISVNLGANAEGRKVTKRVIKFKGKIENKDIS